MMVGRLVSFGEGLFLGAMFNFQGVTNQAFMGSCDFCVFFFSMAAELPLPETNKSHLKMDGWKTMNFPFGMDTFLAGVFAVSFREAIVLKNSQQILQVLVKGGR